jgi:hypothetical protein
MYASPALQLAAETITQARRSVEEKEIKMDLKVNEFNKKPMSNFRLGT